MKQNIILSESIMKNFIRIFLKLLESFSLISARHCRLQNSTSICCFKNDLKAISISVHAVLVFCYFFEVSVQQSSIDSLSSQSVVLTSIFILSDFFIQ